MPPGTYERRRVCFALARSRKHTHAGCGGCWSLSQLQSGGRRSTPWTSRHFITGPTQICKFLKNESVLLLYRGTWTKHIRIRIIFMANAFPVSRDRAVCLDSLLDSGLPPSILDPCCVTDLLTPRYTPPTTCLFHRRSSMPFPSRTYASCSKLTATVSRRHLFEGFQTVDQRNLSPPCPRQSSLERNT
ncbi:uncharacterized protein [Nerophis lumbriciformis]|uniref:uncharacterized protein n=1 Tax=Nerophis lumbriciformis TaxID=546530 RepID=UPI003BACA8ED